MERNLTTGSVLKNILYFSLPYLLSYFLQTLYGMADLFIIGQFNGTESTTAVANGSQVMHMLTVMIVGLAMGSTVIIGRAVGARHKDEIAKTVGNSVTLFMGLSIVLTIVLLLLVRPIVLLIQTPVEAIEGSIRYLTICFIGIPFITAYNIIASICRGMGDSKSPMYFIAIACAANIALDYVFMGVLHLGAAGAALGTTLAQTLSVIISLLMTKKQKLGIKLCKQDFIPSRAVLGEILKIGIPVAIQDGCIQIAFIIITVIANSRGLNDAAAVGIVEKVISALFIVPSSMLATVSALAAQNIGAGKLDYIYLWDNRCNHRRADYRRYRRHLHEGRRGCHAWFTIPAWLYRRLCISRYPFLLQRILLCIRQILYRIHPQYDCDHLPACTGFVSGLEVLRRYIVPDGACGACRIHAFGYYLRGCICMDEETRAPWRQSDTRCILVHIQSRRDMLRFD